MQGNVLGQNNLISKSSKDINFFTYKYIEKDISGIYSTGDDVREISDILSYVKQWTPSGKENTIYGFYNSYLVEFDLKTLQVNVKKLTNFSWDTHDTNTYLDKNYIYVTRNAQYDPDFYTIVKINLQTLEVERMTTTINESGFSTPYINFKYKDYHVATQIYSNVTDPYIIFKEIPNGLEYKTFEFNLGDPAWWVDGIILGSDYNVYVFDEATFDSRNKTYYYYNLGSIEEIYNETNTITGPFCITGRICDTVIQTLCTEYLHYNILNNIMYDYTSYIDSIIKFILKNDYCIIQPIFCEANPNISKYMNFQCYCNEDASIIYTGRYQNKIGLLIADK